MSDPTARPFYEVHRTIAIADAQMAREGIDAEAIEHRADDATGRLQNTLRGVFWHDHDHDGGGFGIHTVAFHGHVPTTADAQGVEDAVGRVTSEFYYDLLTNGGDGE